MGSEEDARAIIAACAERDVHRHHAEKAEREVERLRRVNALLEITIRAQKVHIYSLMHRCSLPEAEDLLRAEDGAGPRRNLIGG